MPRGQPLHQRAACVQPDLQRFVTAEDFQKGTIAVLVGLLDDAVKIANRLVIVQDQGKSNRIWHDGEGAEGYPISLIGSVFGSCASASTSRKKLAASSG